MYCTVELVSKYGMEKRKIWLILHCNIKVFSRSNKSVYLQFVYCGDAVGVIMYSGTGLQVLANRMALIMSLMYLCHYNAWM